MLTLDSATHTYRVDDVVKPGLTSVLRACGVIAFPSIDAAALQMALDRGRKVHLVTQLDDEDDLDESSLSESLSLYLTGWRNAKSDLELVPLIIEQPQYSKHYDFCCTPDRVVSMRGKPNVIVEIKTNHAPSWVRYQLAGQAACFTYPAHYRRLCCVLNAKRQPYYELQDEYPVKEWAQDFEVVRSCLSIINTRHKLYGNSYDASADEEKL